MSPSYAFMSKEGILNITMETEETAKKRQFRILLQNPQLAGWLYERCVAMQNK